MSGAGVKMEGHVYGRTSDKCEHIVGATNSTHDLAATIYSILGVDHQQVYSNIDGRPILVTDNGKPIRGMLA
jgi:arylsulfatase A-like enzyme